jgi:hypothetical protein
MRVLDELEREITRVAEEAGDVRRSGARLAVLPLSLAAVAVAASAFVLTGGSDDPPPAQPAAGGVYGAPAGPGKLLGIRAEDPDGGAPWGLRLTRTTRGFGCVELGRVVDGALGTVDQGGGFRARSSRITEPAHCQVPDAKGRLFIAMGFVGTPASGDPRTCNPQRDCPREFLRTIYFGLLGPEATAVTYRDGDRIVRQAVSRPDGAYLVVKRTPPERRQVGFFTPGVSPASGLRSVEYADGTRCVIPDPRRIGGGRPCPLKGYVEPKLPTVSPGSLATAVRVQVGSRPERPSQLRAPKGAPAQRRVTVRFRARVAADIRSFYTVTSQMKDGGEGCSYVSSGPITAGVAAGSVVRRDLWVPYRCKGTLDIGVGFAQQRRPGQTPFMLEAPGNADVGRVQVKVG